MTIDHSKHLYSVERTYPVLLETLWQAWVDEAALETWYCPTVLKVVPGSVENDVRVDGAWAVAVDVSAFAQPNAYFFGRYTEVLPLERMVHTLHYTTDADEAANRDETTEHHMIVINFEARDGGAWCKFTQYGELPEGQAEQAQAGMESYFDNLSAYLAR